MRWIAQLADCNLDIHYRSGKNNQKADILSRNPNVKRKGTLTHTHLVKISEMYTQSTYIPFSVKHHVENIILSWVLPLP